MKPITYSVKDGAWIFPFRLHRLHKESVMKIVTCLLFALVLIVNSVNANETKVFHWIDDEDYPPLIYRGDDGKPTGIFYEIITEAFYRMNIPIKVELYPWARAQKIVAAGKADGMVTILTSERKPFFLASDPILLVSEHIFLNRHNPRVKEIMSIRSLSKRSLKTIKKYRVVETLGAGWTKEKLKGAMITWVPTLDSAFKMLIKNRADIFILNGFVAAFFLQEKLKEGGSISEEYKNICINPYPLTTIAFRLLIRKGSPFVKILDEFNYTIHQMQKDGTIRHIIEKAHLPHLEGILNQW